MNIAVKPGAFANGFDYFCGDCGRFFSAQTKDIFGNSGEVSFCPCCSQAEPIVSTAELLTYCEFNSTDPVNFYSAFPPDEPIPQSRTGATPKQVEWIVGCVISDKEKKLPVTVWSLAADLGYDTEVVRRVFEELHIIESGVVA